VHELAAFLVAAILWNAREPFRIPPPRTHAPWHHSDRAALDRVTGCRLVERYKKVWEGAFGRVLSRARAMTGVTSARMRTNLPIPHRDASEFLRSLGLYERTVRGLVSFDGMVIRDL
jgi:hypothetical protein